MYRVVNRQAPLHPHLRAELLSSIKPVNEDLSPVILITALLGAQLWAKWDLQEKPYLWCDAQSKGWEQVWLDMLWYFPLKRDCWFKSMLFIASCVVGKLFGLIV
jgi:hypothetical protein